MTWSIRLANGDFDVQNARLGVVRAQDKLVQDFRCAVLTEMGTDPMHPSWGSLIDGGTTPDGRTVIGIIGSTDPDVATMAIETEIRRIATVLQTRQLRRIEQERQVYGKSTLTASEILMGVSDVQFSQVGTTMNVLVTLVTGNSDEVDVTIPLSDSIVGT